MHHDKILVVVQARFASKRLLGKALYPIAGIPVLSFLLRRLKDALPSEKYQIVLATSDQPQDDALAVWGAVEDIPVVRGSENDVLQRYILCLDHFPFQTVVRVTADNPLTCPNILMQVVSLCREKQLDYVQSDNHPYGVGVDVFAAELLRRFARELHDPDAREHINLHILQHPEQFRMLLLPLTGVLARPDLRLTIDTRDDWQAVNALFDGRNDHEPWKITLLEAITRMAA